MLRIACVRILGHLKKKQTIAPLISILLEESESEKVKIAIINVLATLGDNRTVLSLLPILESPDASLREITAYALGEIKAVEAVENLGKALKDSHCYEKWEIQRAGAQIMDEWKVKVYPVRKAAAKALKAIGTPRAMQLLEQNKEYLESEISY